MEKLDFPDIQGLIARGYGKLPAASYLLLQIEEASKARKWLGSILEDITPGDHSPSDKACHVAFTCNGLRALGMDSEDLETFSLPYWQGMEQNRRSRVLGDVGESSPEHWRWGGPATPEIHVLLLLFAGDAASLETAIVNHQNRYQGIKEINRLDTFTIKESREHFGFRDGITQPFIEGFSKSGPPENTVAAGEFILGYKNAYRKMPASPFVPDHRDPDKLLPRVEVETGDGMREVGDFGRNGTYLVFRQLSQDVKGFWGFIDKVARNIYSDSDPQNRLKVAAKMVGRWPGGAPLAICPEEDDPKHSTNHSFSYAGDPDGNFCPLGAHIRRANPRDAMGSSPGESIMVSNRHRMLRRGRPYGAAISRSIDIDGILEDSEDKQECGLHFICLNGDLGRQFEFVQQTWINNPKFAGLYSDIDPLLGSNSDTKGIFTLQGNPVRKRIIEMERFVQLRGGAYFFLPGIRALHYLASLQTKNKQK